MRTALSLSVLLNLVLAGALAGPALTGSRAAGDAVALGRSTGTPGRTGRPGPVGSGGSEQVFDAGPLEAPSYYRALRARGVTHDETKPVLLRHLLRAHEVPSPGAEPYWEPRARAVVERRLETMEAEQAVRETLLDVYGDDAESDPAFAAVFEPLRDRLPFLSSAMQIAVERARLESRLALAAAHERCRRTVGARPCAVSPGADELRGLRGLLDDATLFEIEVRESALAAELRDMHLGLAEQQFRDAYRALAALATPSDAAAIGAARASLRRTLGDARFDRVWAGRDPAFAVVERVLDRHGFTPDQQLAAYGVMNRTQDDLIEAAELAAVDGSRAARLAQEALAAERSRLVDLLGERVTDRLLAERSQLHRELAGGL